MYDVLDLSTWHLCITAMWRARRAVCEDCLVTDVVRTVIAITSTVSGGSVAPTFSGNDFTTPWRTAVETKRTVRERVHLEEIVESRSGVQAPTPSHQSGSRRGDRIGVSKLLLRCRSWMHLVSKTVCGIGGMRINKTDGTTGTTTVTGLGHPGPPVATTRGGRRGSLWSRPSHGESRKYIDKSPPHTTDIPLERHGMLVARVDWRCQASQSHTSATRNCCGGTPGRGSLTSWPRFSVSLRTRMTSTMPFFKLHRGEQPNPAPVRECSKSRLLEA